MLNSKLSVFMFLLLLSPSKELPALSYTVITSYIISVGVQFVRKHDKHELTIGTAISQAVQSLFVTYGILLWWDIKKYDFSAALPVLVLSYGAVIIVNEIEKLFIMTLPKYFNRLRSKITAKDE